jgi:hypothetical protein
MISSIQNLLCNLISRWLIYFEQIIILYLEQFTILPIKNRLYYRRVVLCNAKDIGNWRSCRALEHFMHGRPVKKWSHQAMIVLAMEQIEGAPVAVTLHCSSEAWTNLNDWNWEPVRLILARHISAYSSHTTLFNLPAEHCWISRPNRLWRLVKRYVDNQCSCRHGSSVSSVSNNFFSIIRKRATYRVKKNIVKFYNAGHQLGAHTHDSCQQ